MFVLHILRRRREGGEEGILFKTVEDICTKFTDKYRLPLPITPPISTTFFFVWLMDSNPRNSACYICTKPPYILFSPPLKKKTITTEMIGVSNRGDLCVTLPERSERLRTFPQLRLCQRNLFLFFSHFSNPADVRAPRCYCVCTWLNASSCSPFTYF